MEMASDYETANQTMPNLTQVGEYLSSLASTEDFWTDQLKFAQVYIFPCIVLGGFLGNVGLVIVACKRSLFKLAPMNSIAAIVTADTGYLLLSVFPWIHSNFYVQVYNIVGLCQLINFGVTFFLSLSFALALTTACLHLVWVKAPKTGFELPSVFFTRVALVGVTLLMVYAHAYIFWFWEVSEDTQFQCAIHFDNSKSFSAYLTYELAMSMVLIISLFAVTSAVSYTQKSEHRLIVREHSQLIKQGSCHSKGTLEQSARQKLESLKPVNILWAFSLAQFVLAAPCTMIVMVSILSQCIPPLYCIVVSSVLLHLNFSVKPVALIIISPHIRHAVMATIRPQYADPEVIE